MIQEKPRYGLVCCVCGAVKFSTVYTRHRCRKIQRRKQCVNCGHEVITVEKILRNIS